MKARGNIKLEIENSDSDVNLDNTTCTHETLAFLNRSDEERKMNDEEWHEFYTKRFKEDYYDEHGGKRLTEEERLEYEISSALRWF